MANECPLRFTAREHSFVGRSKSKEHAVALGSHLDAVRSGRFANELALKLNQLLIGLAAQTGQRWCRSLNIGKTQGDNSRRQVTRLIETGSLHR